MTLLDRIIAAEGPTRELFEEAFVAIHGPKPPRVNGGSQEWINWLNLHNPFARMLDAKAWTSAAEMLVPEGWSFDLSKYHAVQDGDWVCLVGEDDCWVVKAEGQAATPALALLAAILRAERKDDHVTL